MKWYKKIGGLSFLLLHFVCCLCLVCLFVFFSYSGRYNFVYVGGGERGIKSSQYLNFKEEQWEGVQTVVQQMWVSELLCSSRKYPWGRGVWKAQFLNERMTLKWNFRRGERVQFKKPPMGGVWIFSGTTHYHQVLLLYCLFLPLSNNLLASRSQALRLFRFYYLPRNVKGLLTYKLGCVAKDVMVK